VTRCGDEVAGGTSTAPPSTGLPASTQAANPPSSTANPVGRVSVEAQQPPGTRGRGGVGRVVADHAAPLAHAGPAHGRLEVGRVREWMAAVLSAGRRRELGVEVDEDRTGTWPIS
jgi:hypothetical protein